MSYITFETKCWEMDWRRVLAPGHIESRIEAERILFDERVLWINNVSEPDRVLEAASVLVGNGVLTSARLVEPLLDSSLAAFSLDRDALGIGLWYSSAEIVGLHECRTRWLLHYASDAGLRSGGGWAMDATSLMDSDREVAVCNPAWNGNVAEVEAEAFEHLGSWAFGHGFSDQCYLVEAGRWRGADLSLDHPSSVRYPGYGGPLFERRANSYMRSNGLLRATDLRASYVHPIF